MTIIHRLTQGTLSDWRLLTSGRNYSSVWIQMDVKEHHEHCKGIRSDFPAALHPQLLSPPLAALCKLVNWCRRRLSHFAEGARSRHHLCILRHTWRCWSSGGRTGTACKVKRQMSVMQKSFAAQTGELSYMLFFLSFSLPSSGVSAFRGWLN